MISPPLTAGFFPHLQPRGWRSGLPLFAGLLGLLPPGATAADASAPGQTAPLKEKLLFYAGEARKNLLASKPNYGSPGGPGASEANNVKWDEVATLLAEGGDYQGALAAAAYPRDYAEGGYSYFCVGRVQARAGDITGARESLGHVSPPDTNTYNWLRGEIALAQARQGDLTEIKALLTAPLDAGDDNHPGRGVYDAFLDPVLAGNAQDRALLDQVLAAVLTDRAKAIPRQDAFLALQGIARARAGQFDQARRNLPRIQNIYLKIWLLRNLVLSQVKAGDRAGARQTLAPIRDLIEKDFASDKAEYATGKAAEKGAEDYHHEYFKRLCQVATSQMRTGDLPAARATLEALKEPGHHWQYGPAMAELAAFQAESGDLTGADEAARAIPEEDSRARGLGYVAQVQWANGRPEAARRDVQEGEKLLRTLMERDNHVSSLSARPVTKAMAELGDLERAAHLARFLDPARRDFVSIDSTKDIAAVVARQLPPAKARDWVEVQTTNPYMRAMYFAAMGRALIHPDEVVYTTSTEDP